MPTTISNNSKELFFSIAQREFHKYKHVWQYQERKSIVNMLEDFGMKNEANELRELL